ncbi:MAG: topoisomerase C-terminal repeat-containing protein, partial [Nocardioidaceae bacterium]
FGPYVTDGEYNATLRQGDDESTISLERAAELLAEKRAKGPAPKKRGAKKATAKKATGKKAASSKTKKAASSTAKKSTTKKAAAKKSS